MFEGYTPAELATLLQEEREQVASWASIARVATGRGRREAIAAMQASQSLVDAILATGRV